MTAERAKQARKIRKLETDARNDADLTPPDEPECICAEDCGEDTCTSLEWCRRHDGTDDDCPVHGIDAERAAREDDELREWFDRERET